MRTRFILGVLLLLASTLTWASGTMIYEQGSKATAQGGAFVARADDATAVFYNPAGIAFMKKMSFAFNTTYINVDVNYNSPTFGSYKNNAKNFFLPGLYFTMPINDVVSWGIMANSPFNLATDWDDVFPGRFVSRHAKINTLDIRPVIAFRLGQYNALSVGVDYYDSQVNLIRASNTSALSTALNPHTYPSPPYPPGIPYYRYSEGRIKTDLSDHSWGWNISYMFNMKPWSFGATYRSRASFDYEGKTHFGTSALLAPIYGLFPTETTRMSLKSTPAVAVIGLAYAPGRFTVEFDVQWTEWSSWGRTQAKFNTPTMLNGTYIVPPYEDFVFDWGNTWCWRLGFGYKISDTWEVRWGALYDQAPVPSSTVSPVLPDSNRWSVQFGMGYEKSGFTFDWYVMYLKFQNADINSNNIYRYGYTGLPDVVLPGQPNGGHIYPVIYPITPDGYYKGQAYLGGFQLGWKF